MSTRNLLLPLLAIDGVNGWLNLAERIRLEQIDNDATDLPTNCNTLTITSPETNVDGTYVEITSDPVTFTPAFRLLKEESKEYLAHCYNNISTMDKWVRIVDEMGDPTGGDVRVNIEYA